MLVRRFGYVRILQTRSLPVRATPARRLVVFLALFVVCATWSSTGRIVNKPCTHVGIRPVDLTMVDDESDGTGVSVRVSTDAPACHAVYPNANVHVSPVVSP